MILPLRSDAFKMLALSPGSSTLEETRNGPTSRSVNLSHGDAVCRVPAAIDVERRPIWVWQTAISIQDNRWSLAGIRSPDQDVCSPNLLARITRVHTQLIPAGLKHDIVTYYADPAAPISTKKKAKEWTSVQEQLQVLIGMKTL